MTAPRRTSVYTITISELDEFEADHIAGIFQDYKSKILEYKLEAISQKDESLSNWHDDHLKWHGQILTKIKWTKEENDNK